MLPTKSSISISLDALKTTTEIDFSDSDSIRINGVFADSDANVKVLRFLHLFRRKFSSDKFFRIDSVNNFPTSAGLASSASAFAALAKGLNKLCDLNLDSKELSILARLGSGSASRSVLGGFNLWLKGKLLDGTDSYAEQLFKSDYWPEFMVIIVVVQTQKKHISSTCAMQITVKTSKIYQNWITSSERRIAPMISAIENRDLSALGELAQVDCLEMHETMHTSNPMINYWTDKTVKVIELVNNLRASGVPAYFTIDAGPNVKILTLDKYQDKILSELANIEDIQAIVSGVAHDDCD
jgi:diphosphomevalonate decarboxylase